MIKLIPCLSPNGGTSYHLPAQPMRLIVGTTDGVMSLVRSESSGAWRIDQRSLRGKYISAMVSLPSGHIFAGVYRGGIYRSQDGGATWQPAMAGLTINHVYSLATAEEPSGVILYAGTEPVSLFRSRDLGDHWEMLPAIGLMPGREKWWFPPPPHVAHTKSLTTDSRDLKRIYAAVEQGALLRTNDGGESWIELDDYARTIERLNRDVHRIVQAPWAPDILFLANGGIGCFRSADAGEHWEHIPELDREIRYPDAMVASPRDDHMLIVCGARGNPFSWFRSGKAEGMVMRSRDGGKSWEPAKQGLPIGGRANFEAMTIVSSPEGISLFVGDTDGDIFLSEDLGGRWSKIMEGGPPIAKSGHHVLLRAVSAIPRWIRPVVALVAMGVLRISARVAAIRRQRRVFAGLS